MRTKVPDQIVPTLAGFIGRAAARGVIGETVGEASRPFSTAATPTATQAQENSVMGRPASAGPFAAHATDEEDAMPKVTHTAPSGLNSGIQDGVIASARDLARVAGAKDALPHSAQEKGRDLTPEEMHENVEASKASYANHPYYSGKEGSDTENANLQFGKSRGDDAKPNSVRSLARMAGAKP